MEAWERAKAIGSFINQIGVPAFCTLVLTVVLAGWATGYFENPLVTKQQFEAHAKDTTQLHSTLIGIGREEIAVLKEITKEFKAVRCERKIRIVEQLECLSALSREP